MKHENKQRTIILMEFYLNSYFTPRTDSANFDISGNLLVQCIKTTRKVSLISSECLLYKKQRKMDKVRERIVKNVHVQKLEPP